MIQRIQTIYLLLGAIAVLALFLFDGIWASQAAETLAWFAPALAISIIVTAVAGIGVIFMYRDRKRHHKFVGYVQALTLAVMVVLYAGLFLSGEISAFDEGGLRVGRLAALLLPVVAYILFHMARRAIKADIDLVKSMDRLR